LNLQNDCNMILKFLYENDTVNTLGLDLFDVGRKLDINNGLKVAAQAIVRDGFAEYTSGSKIKLTFYGMEQVELSMNIDEKVKENRNKRQRFLNLLYEKHRSENPSIEIEDCIQLLGFDRTQIISMLRYYIYKKYVEQRGIGGPLKITIDGIREVEKNRGL
jgi:hypothetical protein